MDRLWRGIDRVAPAQSHGYSMVKLMVFVMPMVANQLNRQCFAHTLACGIQAGSGTIDPAAFDSGSIHHAIRQTSHKINFPTLKSGSYASFFL
jgi:hypothetical protein